MKEYRHKLVIFNTYCFSTATIFTRTLLSVTFICTLPALYVFKTDPIILIVVLSHRRDY